MRKWVVTAALLLAGCAAPLSSQQASRLSMGFWFWGSSSPDFLWRSSPVDVIFVHVGDISKEPIPLYVRKNGGPTTQWNAWASLPNELPDAKEYWLVWRYRNQGVPDTQVVPKIAENFARVFHDGRMRRLKIVGLQLDIDSPTASLASYALFLHEVRRQVGPGVQISITALFDWFRGGTKIGDVIAQVDEFVPQFYDAGPPDHRDGAIEVAVEPARCGPIFNQFGKRFRIGISTFGRARFLAKQASAHGNFGIAGFRDLTPLDMASNSAFQMVTERTPAGEILLTYRAVRAAKISYTDFNPGDGIQFTLPTAEAVRTAVSEARQIGGNVAGVVFFRWPSENETLAMQPDEVLQAAGILPAGSKTTVEAIDGACAAVKCVDLYFRTAFTSKSGRYRIRSSSPLEYFLPEKTVPVRMTGATVVELSLPPFAGRGRIYLGRAVSVKAAAFTVEPGS